VELEQIWWGEAPERPKIVTRLWSESMLSAVTRPESAPSRFCICDILSIRNHTVEPRLGQFSSLAARRDACAPAALLEPLGLSGASPYQTSPLAPKQLLHRIQKSLSKIIPVIGRL